MTKKVHIKTCQIIRDKYKNGEFITGVDIGVMAFYLEKHRWYKQKTGGQYYKIYVDTNPVYKTRGFFIEREDGSTTDFSFYECIYPTKVFKQDFIKGARAAIAVDITATKLTYFDATTSPVCVLCEKPISINNSHADHYPIKFETLLNDFIKENNIKAFEKLTEPETWDNKIGCEITDEKIKFKWIYYHMKYAKLRMLCPECNLRLK